MVAVLSRLLRLPTLAAHDGRAGLGEWAVCGLCRTSILGSSTWGGEAEEKSSSNGKHTLVDSAALLHFNLNLLFVEMSLRKERGFRKYPPCLLQFPRS